MSVLFADETWRQFREKCEDVLGDGGLVSIRLTKAKKSYRIDLVADLHEGPRTRWTSEAIKYPKSNKNRRDHDAEDKFLNDWWPYHSGGSIVPRLRDFRHDIEAAEEATREKRPRDCHQSAAPDHARPEKRGGKREGAGRPRGSFGPKAVRERLERYKAAEKDGRLHDAQNALRDLPNVMRQAARDTEQQLESWTPAFLLRQRNRGHDRKAALRKLRKARKQWEKALLEAAACRQSREEAVAYCREVEKECLGAAAVHSTGLEVRAVAVFLAVLDVLLSPLKDMRCCHYCCTLRIPLCGVQQYCRCGTKQGDLCLFL